MRESDSHLAVFFFEEILFQKLVSRLLCVPATSEFKEKVFSVINAKWRDDRNKASIKLIRNYLNLCVPRTMFRCHKYI